MWPWGHLAIAYLAYAAWSRLDERRVQTLGTLTALAVGSQFPDLVDKPLAWTVAILPSGRSLAHSLFTFAAMTLLMYALAQRVRRRDLAIAFAAGWLVHILTDLPPDAILALAQGDTSQGVWIRFVAWPLVAPPPYPNDDSFVEHFANFALDPFVLVQVALVGLAIVVWVLEDRPGWRALRGRLGSLRTALI